MKKHFKKTGKVTLNGKKTSKPKKMCSTKHRTKDMMKFPFKSAGEKKTSLDASAL
jgi:hypothetical protein